MSTKLSVNINKIATLRNARGGNIPDIVKVAQSCEVFGAEGITVHPRPDERHVTGKDVYDLAETVTTEFNIEGYPNDRYLQFIKDVKPAQATLVPDPPEAITSNAGWDIVKHYDFLAKVVDDIKKVGSRVSIFVYPYEEDVLGAKKVGADRVELFTEPFAVEFKNNKEKAVKDYVNASQIAKDTGLGVNAGHDLDLFNLQYLFLSLPKLDEVSIGHALISDSLYFGLENTIQLYKGRLRPKAKE